MEGRAQSAIDYVNERLGTNAVLLEKQKSWLHKLINLFLWLPTRGSYMMSFWTTFGRRIYAPRLRGPFDWIVVFHELTHVRQSQKEGKLHHAVDYLFPQIVSVWAVAALFLFGAGWWSLLGLLFLLPWPAYFRMRKELEAYKMSIAAIELRRPGSGPQAAEAYLQHFTGPNYYFMWPFKKLIRFEFQEHLQRISGAWSYSIIDGVDRMMYGCLFGFMAREGLLDPTYATQYGFDEPTADAIERN